MKLVPRKSQPKLSPKAPLNQALHKGIIGDSTCLKELNLLLDDITDGKETRGLAKGKGEMFKGAIFQSDSDA